MDTSRSGTNSNERIFMVTLKYKGTDPRLEYGKAYDCTISKEKNPDGRTYVSVHVSLQGRVYKSYPHRVFDREWEKV